MVRTLLLLFALITPAIAAAQAAPDQPPAPEVLQPSRKFTPRDVFALSKAEDVQISPNGRRIAYTRATGDIMIDGDRQEIWLVDVASGRQDSLGVPGSSRPRWSPDGSRLAFAAKAEGAAKPQVWTHWFASGANAALAPLPEPPTDLAWSPDGRSIALVMFVAGDGAKLGAPIAKPDGAKWADPLRIIDRVHFREDGDGYLRPGFNHVFVVSAEGGAARQLTFGDHDDGRTVAWTADSRSLLIATNHGKDWERQPLNTDLFRVDAATGELTQLTSRDGPDEAPTASPDGRLIAFTGFEDRLLGYQNAQLSVMNADGSGGGLLTAWIVGKTGRFKAAVSQKPVINWTSEVLTTDGYNSMARYWFGPMPWEDHEHYWRRSPLSLVGTVTTPTAVMVGEEDHRTPPSEAEQLYAALQLRSVPTVLIRVPSASHGGLADRPSQLVAENAAILAWFERYRHR